MMQLVLRGVVSGALSVSSLMGALALWIYQAGLSDKGETTYFRFIALFVPIGLLLYQAEDAFSAIIGQPAVVIVAAAVVDVLGLVTCACIMAKEIKRSMK